MIAPLEGTSPAHAAEPAANAAPWTWLVVDDHVSVLITLEFVFGSHGRRTVLAATGERALELASREIDAALLDLHLPGMDGLTLCRTLRGRMRSTGHWYPIWLMTGAYTAALQGKAIEAGAVAILQKPFDVERFLADSVRVGVGKPQGLPTLNKPGSQPAAN